MIDVCLLGCGGMMPLQDRWLTALLIRMNGSMTLIDCGEATQIPLKATGWGCKAVERILITHYHADHVAGLPGLLLTIGNCGREEPLTIYGPEGLGKVIEGISVICPELPFEIRTVELPHEMSEIKIDYNLTIKYAPAEHRLPCLAYSFEVRRQGRFDPAKAEANRVPMKFWSRLQKGEVIYSDNTVYYPHMILGEERKGLKIVYCTDTRPTDTLAKFANNADLLVCEGIYGQDELIPKAVEKKHMTFSEAASMARRSNSRELWLTHFSPSMENPEEYLHYATDIFLNTKIGKNIMKKTLYFED